MDPLHPSFALVAFLIAFASSWVLVKITKPVFSNARFETLDGFRGLLAMSVFMHHCAIWYLFLNHGVWDKPWSDLYIQFGKSGVAFFFMITSFLFVNKLIITRKEGLDWGQYFFGRIKRLFPSYYFSLILIILLIFIVDHWKLNTDPNELKASISKWLLFTIPGDPQINGNRLTVQVNAGVFWSLPYEWLFYFVLPIFGLFISKVKPKVIFLMLSLIFIIIFLFVHKIDWEYIGCFAGGIVAAFLIQIEKLRKYAQHWMGSLLVLGLVIFLPKIQAHQSVLYLVVITVIFSFIACGNSVFGALKTPALKLLGEISYSTYLLHGIVLFVVNYFIIEINSMKIPSPFSNALYYYACIPVIVLVSYLSYRFIEKPFLKK